MVFRLAPSQEDSLGLSGVGALDLGFSGSGLVRCLKVQDFRWVRSLKEFKLNYQNNVENCIVYSRLW